MFTATGMRNIIKAMKSRHGVRTRENLYTIGDGKRKRGEGRKCLSVIHMLLLRRGTRPHHHLPTTITVQRLKMSVQCHAVYNVMEPNRVPFSFLHPPMARQSNNSTLSKVLVPVFTAGRGQGSGTGQEGREGGAGGSWACLLE